MDKISIITICKNCKSDFDITAQSIVKQDYPNIEWIVIDGGSIDGTVESINNVAENISYFVSESDNGVYDAINKGIKAATGEWILCLNAGDYLTTDDILTKALSLEDLDRHDALYSDCVVISRNGKKYGSFMNHKTGLLHHQNFIYRRKLHAEHGMYLVTKPYIVSDLLFMLSLDRDLYKKLDTPIAYSKSGGISSGIWSGEQAIGLRISMGLISMPRGFMQYLKLYYIFLKKRLLHKH